MRKPIETNLRIALVTVLAATGSAIAFMTALLGVTGSSVLLLGILLASVVLFNAGRVAGRGPDRTSIPFRTGRRRVEPLRRKPPIQPVVSSSRLASAACQVVRDAVIGMDAETRIVLVNRGAELLFGYRREELLGSRCSQSPLAPLSETGLPLCDTQNCPIQQVLPAGGKTEGLATMRRSDGSRLIAAYRFEGISGDSGRTLGVIAVYRDVTESREFERIRTDFLSVVSHELLTPLTSIRGSLGLLVAWARKEGRQDEVELLEICAKNSGAMEKHIQEVLDLTGLESGRNPLKRAPSSAAREVEAAVEEIRPFARGKSVRLDLTVAPSIPLVSLDPLRFRQAINCLLRNGVQFSPADGALDVRVGIPAEAVLDLPGAAEVAEVEISVADQGPGIPVEDRRWVFERLTQMDTTAGRSHQGLGLGLALAKAIVEHHRGRIWVQDGPDGGADFRIRLPALPAV